VAAVQDAGKAYQQTQDHLDLVAVVASVVVVAYLEHQDKEHQAEMAAQDQAQEEHQVMVVAVVAVALAHREQLEAHMVAQEAQEQHGQELVVHTQVAVAHTMATSPAQVQDHKVAQVVAVLAAGTQQFSVEITVEPILVAAEAAHTAKHLLVQMVDKHVVVADRA
jgi:hypothetical protein